MSKVALSQLIDALGEPSDESKGMKPTPFDRVHFIRLTDDMGGLRKLFGGRRRGGGSLGEFWSKLLSRVRQVVASGEVCGEEDTVSLSADVRFLLAATRCCEAAGPAGAAEDASARALVGDLSTLIFELKASAGHPLQDAISRVCEQCFARKAQGFEALMPQAFTYLLARSLEPGATTADLKRLYAVRDALSLFDFEDCSIDTVRNLLLRCAVTPIYLRATQGIQFLASLFALGPRMLRPLHATIKNQIPYASASSLRTYSRVYYTAWKASEDSEYHARIERECLQDIMAGALHAAAPETSRNANTLLNHIHSHKGELGVDAMLYRLWGPLLWRSLKVANARVRRNATRVFGSVFPLTDPDSKARDVEAEIARQAALFTDILADEDASVRAAGAEAATRALGLYWDLVPSADAGALLKRLVTRLAFDAASATVRTAVVRGLTFMADNHLAHPVLKAALPRTKTLLHDASQAVRRAYVALLEKVSSLKGLKFYEIAPISDLLKRLACEGPSVARPIVRLLQSSFFPHQKSAGSQLARALALCATPQAARVFFSHVHKCVPLKAVCKFLAIAAKALVTRREPPAKDMVDSKGSAGPRPTLAGSAETLLLCMVQLWRAVRPRLNKPSKIKLREYLQAAFSDDAVAALLKIYGPVSTAARAAIYKMVTFVPNEALPNTTKSALRQLAALGDAATSQQYGPLLDCVFAWSQHAGLVTVIAEAVQAFAGTFVAGEDDDDDEAPPAVDPHLALKFLAYIVRTEATREALMAEPELVDAVGGALAACVVAVQAAIATGDCDETERSCLLLGFQMHCQLQLFCSFAVDGDGDEKSIDSKQVSPQLRKTIEFVSAVVVPEVEATPTLVAKKSPRKRRKRKEASAGPTTAQKLAFDVLCFATVFAGDMMALGVVDSDCPMAFVSEWSTSVRSNGPGVAGLSSDQRDTFAAALCKATFQYANAIVSFPNTASSTAADLLCECMAEAHAWADAAIATRSASPAVLCSFSELVRNVLKLDYKRKVHAPVVRTLFTLAARGCNPRGGGGAADADDENKIPDNAEEGASPAGKASAKGRDGKVLRAIEDALAAAAPGVRPGRSADSDFAPASAAVVKGLSRFKSQILHFADPVARAASEWQDEEENASTGVLLAIHHIAGLSKRFSARFGRKSDASAVEGSLMRCVQMVSAQ